MKQKNIKFAPPRLSAKGKFKWEILEAGNVVRRSKGWQKNLITDAGLDGINLRTWEDSMLYCVIGTGTDPMVIDSGTTTASRTGSTVTANAAIFAPAHAGAVIKWDSGEEAYIQTYTDSQNVETIDSGAIGSGEFTVHRVNKNSMETETKRSNSYAPGASNCGLEFNGTTKTNRIFRTYVFSAETGAVTYNEIGVSHTPTAGANLFARAIISGGVSLADTQQLRVTYSLTITLDNANIQTAVVVPITGLIDDNATQLAYLRGIRGIQDSGADEQSYCFDSLEPSVGMEINVSELAQGGGFSTFADRQASYVGSGNKLRKSALKAAYTAGNFYADFSVLFSTSEANGLIEWISFGSFNGYIALAIQLVTPFTKTADDTLALAFRLSWGRNLVN